MSLASGSIEESQNPEMAVLFLAQMPALSPASESPFSAPPDPYEHLSPMTERIGFYTESSLCEVLTRQQDCLEETHRSCLSQAALQQLASQEENLLGCCRHHLCSTQGDAVWPLLP